MKKLTLTIASFLLFFGISFSTYAADNNTDSHTLGIGITSHAMLKIVSTGSNGTSISLTPNAPTAAGDGIDFADVINTDLWLNYSTIMSHTDQTFSISAEITTSDIPSGISLFVNAATASGDSRRGTLGTGQGNKDLSVTSPGNGAVVISGIGSCHTGVGVNKGSNLTYTAQFDDATDNYAALVQNDYSATITYTITADN